MIFAKDAEGRFILANQAVADAYGTTVEALIGTRQETVHTATNELARMLEEDRLVMRHGRPKYVPESSFTDSSGRRRILQKMKIPYSPEGLDRPAVLGVAIDITPLKAAQHGLIRSEAALRESEQRFQQVALAIHHVLWLTDWSDHTIIYCNEAYERIWGRPRESLYAHATDWVDAIHPDDRERVSRAFFTIAEREHFDERYRIVQPDGTVRWIRDRGYPVRNEEGEVHRIAGIAEDITEQKKVEDRQKFLMHELDHRVKNNLASVQSVAQQTLASVSTMEAFAEAFTTRLHAMAIAHETLAGRHWEGAELRVLLGRLTEPYWRGVASQVELTGRDILLSPEITMPLCLVLNELVTNAAKHGALTREDGEVRIEWTVDASDDAQTLDLTWTEHGCTDVTAPTRTGFGTKLIQRMTAYELRGDADLDFAPTGVRCRIRFPLPDRPNAMA
jgi:PAS domain S-box-containing protein